MVKVRTLLGVLVIPLFLNGSVHAAPEPGLDPDRALWQFARASWTKRQGLPQNSVISIAQTADGYLWFGTMEGLARFDGTAFRIYNTRNTPVLRDNYILALHAGPDSTLWIGTLSSGIVRMKRGTFTRLAAPTLPDRCAAASFFRDRHGTLWSGTSVGLAAIQADTVATIYGNAEGIPAGMVLSVCEDRDGSLLVATKAGVLALKEGCFAPYAPLAGVDAPVEKMLLSGDGSLVLGVWGKGLYRADRGVLTRLFALDSRTSGEAIKVVYEDRRGTLWFGKGMSGLSRLVGGRLASMGSADGLSSDEVLSILEDHEGNLWVGTATGGVNRFVNSKFITFHTGVTASETMVWSLFEDQEGTILAGNAAGKILRLREGRFEPDPRIPRPIGGIPATYLHERRSGRLWIGSPTGIHEFVGGRTVHHDVGYVSALIPRSAGGFWVGTPKGLHTFDGKELRPVSHGLSFKGLDARFLLEDSGYLWIASRRAGLARCGLHSDGTIDSSRVRFWNAETGFPTNWVASVVKDNSGTIWVTSYGGGLSRLVGDSLVSYTVAHGLPEGGIHSLLDDGLGSLWLSTNNGILRLHKRDFDAFIAKELTIIPTERFGLSDGMTSDECNGGFQHSGLRSRDGRLWFPTIDGVVMVDPTSMPVNSFPPELVFERVAINSREYFLHLSPTVPPGRGDLVFEYAALSYAVPEKTQYSVMLEGFDRNWISVGSRRESFYTNMPPGTYTFRVRAANADGVWNEAGIAYTFTLEPHFYQTTWFYLLCMLGVVGLAGGGHSLYRRDRDRELLASQLESRLAQAQLRLLEMQLQPHFLFNTLNGIMVLIRQEPDKAAKMVARLSELLRLTLENNGKQEITLQQELEFVDRYLAIEKVRFEDRLTVREEIRSDLREAMVPNMVLQPLVENAIRHGVSRKRGQATIAISAERDNGSLVIHVVDNGAGLNGHTSQNIREGIGISNIRARLRHLYGERQRFELQSPPDGGVEARLTIPFHTEMPS